MIISKLEARNVCGRSFTENLAPVTIFTGPNDSGKTTRLRVAQWCLSGRVPGLPDTAAGLFDMSSGQFMAGGVVLDSGQFAQRKIEQKPDGGLKGTDNVDKFFDDLPAVLIDAQVFLGKSARLRTDMILKMMPTGEIRDENARMEAAILAALPVESHPLIKKQFAQLLSCNSPHAWLQAAGEQIREAANKAEGAAKGMAKTAIGLGDLSFTETAPPPNVDAELSTKREAKAKLDAEFNGIAKREQDAQRVAGQRKAATESATGLAAKQAALNEAKAAVETMRKLVQEYRSQTPVLSPQVQTLKMKVTNSKKLLEHDACPMCKTEGGKWKAGLKKEIKTAEMELGELQSKLDKALLADGKYATHVERLQDMETVFAERTTVMQKANSAVELLKALPKEEDAGKLAELRKDLELQSQSRQADIWQLELKQRQYIQHRADLSSQQNARAQADKIKLEAVAYKAAGKVIEERSAEVVTEAFGKILAVANELAAPILPSPLAFHDDEIGFWKEVEGKKRFVKNTTLGGCMQGVAFAAISLALGYSSPLKVVLMDSIDGAMDDENKDKFMALVTDLVDRGVISQFIGTHCRGKVPDGKGGERDWIEASDKVKVVTL